MTEPHVGYSKNQIAQAVLDTELDTTPANAVVIDAVAKFCPQFDQRGRRVRCTTFSSSSAKARVADTSCGRFTPPDEDDARQTHQDNYADEPIVAVHQ